MYKSPYLHVHCVLVMAHTHTHSEEKVDDIGPVEEDKDEIRPDPLSLPEHFTWDDIDLLDDAQVCTHAFYMYMYMYMCCYTVHVQYMHCYMQLCHVHAM